ncbi:hypothetical protein CEXT_241301 [Caerostris extrusa]|uniref:Uncharacterized protein n=1 Tax=Caerostris extrusa TaxID=172846 RepID=A0AAV4XZ31_CAEEX|nr:hypothetical protein CEXT_241301 [Caerostris extrusa]
MCIRERLCHSSFKGGAGPSKLWGDTFPVNCLQTSLGRPCLPAKHKFGEFTGVIKQLMKECGAVIEGYRHLGNRERSIKELGDTFPVNCLANSLGSAVFTRQAQVRRVRRV